MRDSQRAFMERKLGKKTPAFGDVVISCIGRPPLVYRVGVTPAIADDTFADYEAALTRARQVALQMQVDAWVAEDGEDVMLVARHRPDSDSSPPATEGSQTCTQ